LARGFQRTDATFEGRRATRSAVWTISGLLEVGGHQKHHLDRGGGRRRRRSDAGVDVPTTRPGRTSAAPARPNLRVDTMKRPNDARKPHRRLFGGFSSRRDLFWEAKGSSDADFCAAKAVVRAAEAGVTPRQKIAHQTIYPRHSPAADRRGARAAAERARARTPETPPRGRAGAATASTAGATRLGRSATPGAPRTGRLRKRVLDGAGARLEPRRTSTSVRPASRTVWTSIISKKV